MKNKRINMLLALFLGLSFIFIFGCGHKKSTPMIPASLFENIGFPELSLSETTYHFDGVVVNNNADREFTITNTGTGDLNVTDISSDKSEFDIISENCTTQQLGSNENCTFIVRFSPITQGSFTGNITVTSNVPPERTITVDGDGYGLNVWINQADFTTCSDATVDVTVTDADGPVIFSTNIEDHFRLWQNDTEIEIVSVSTIINPDPVSVVLALDLSSSLSGAITTIKTHAKYFIELLGDSDQAAIYKFQMDILYYPSSSFIPTDAAGITDLQNHIDPPDPGTGGTALYNALYASITRAAEETVSKKAVVVLSDGNNENSSGYTLEQVIDHAQILKVPIFTIYYTDPAYPYAAKPGVLKQLAQETGGQDYYSETSSMENIFSQIRNILGSKYTIVYDASPNCTGSIPIRVRVDWDHDGSAGTPDLYGIDSRTFTP